MHFQSYLKTHCSTAHNARIKNKNKKVTWNRWRCLEILIFLLRWGCSILFVFYLCLNYFEENEDWKNILWNQHNINHPLLLLPLSNDSNCIDKQRAIQTSSFRCRGRLEQATNYQQPATDQQFQYRFGSGSLIDTCWSGYQCIQNFRLLVDQQIAGSRHEKSCKMSANHNSGTGTTIKKRKMPPNMSIFILLIYYVFKYTLISINLCLGAL